MIFARYLRFALISFVCLGVAQPVQGMNYLRSIVANIYAFYSHSSSYAKTIDSSALENSFQYSAVGNLPLQTQCHLKNNVKVLASGLVRKYLETPELRNLWEAINYKEYQLHEDYYTFVHGQKNQLYWPEKLYTFLWSKRYKKPVKDFLFAHVKPALDPSCDASGEEERHRVFLLNNRKFAHKETIYKRILFMNYALFANDGWHGNNSAYLISQNFSWNHAGVFLKAADVCDLLGYARIYEEFAPEIEELASGYKNLSVFGNALLIAVPKNDIQHYVFLTDDNGRRRSIYIEGIGKTDDIKIIMEAIINTPEKLKTSDLLQFGLVMFHKNGGLDPETGIKVFPFITGDQDKIAMFNRKEEILFEKIERALQRDEKIKQSINALNRAARIVDHVVASDDSADLNVSHEALVRAQILISHIQPDLVSANK